MTYTQFPTPTGGLQSIPEYLRERFLCDHPEESPAIVERCPGCGCPLAPGADTCGRHACVEGVNGSPDYGELEAWLSRVESAPPART